MAAGCLVGGANVAGPSVAGGVGPAVGVNVGKADVGLGVGSGLGAGGRSMITKLQIMLATITMQRIHSSIRRLRREKLLIRSSPYDGAP